MPLPDPDARIFESVARVLVNSGWMDSFSATGNSVYRVEWTDKGRQRSHLVRLVIEDYGLDDSPEAAMRFTSECRGLADDHAERSKVAAGAYWLACIDELGLTMNHEVLRIFVGLMAAGGQGSVKL